MEHQKVKLKQQIRLLEDIVQQQQAVITQQNEIINVLQESVVLSSQQSNQNLSSSKQALVPLNPKLIDYGPPSSVQISLTSQEISYFSNRVTRFLAIFRQKTQHLKRQKKSIIFNDLPFTRDSFEAIHNTSDQQFLDIFHEAAFSTVKRAVSQGTRASFLAVPAQPKIIQEFVGVYLGLTEDSKGRLGSYLGATFSRAVAVRWYGYQGLLRIPNHKKANTTFEHALCNHPRSVSLRLMARFQPETPTVFISIFESFMMILCGSLQRPRKASTDEERFSISLYDAFYQDFPTSLGDDRFNLVWSLNQHPSRSMVPKDFKCSLCRHQCPDLLLIDPETSTCFCRSCYMWWKRHGKPDIPAGFIRARLANTEGS